MLMFSHLQQCCQLATFSAVQAFRPQNDFVVDPLPTQTLLNALNCKLCRQSRETGLLFIHTHRKTPIFQKSFHFHSILSKPSIDLRSDMSGT
jgi:hypothetical protein